DFPSLSSDLPDALNCAPITHDAADLSSDLPSHDWLSGRTFRGCLHCFLQLYVFQRCLNKTCRCFIKHRAKPKALSHLSQSFSWSCNLPQ
ncbi:unnamed protein product, partial [Bubo scandiacus]